jgi:hypothetical protein
VNTARTPAQLISFQLGTPLDRLLAKRQNGSIPAIGNPFTVNTNRKSSIKPKDAPIWDTPHSDAQIKEQ